MLTVGEKLLKEIHSTALPKLFNIENGTASEHEIFIYKECQGFIDLIRYSVMPVNEIKRLWDSSLLAYK